MPAKSEAQKRLMDAAAHNPAFAKKVGIPSKVAKDFSEASIGMKFGKGGAESQPQRQSVNQPKTNHGEQSLFSKGGKTMAKADLKKLFKGKESYKEEMAEAKAIKSGKITPSQYARGEKMEETKKMARGGGVETKGKTKGKVITMCGGGMSKKK